MGQKIIRFELEGTAALGFDTGLNAKAFAQAKISQFINRTGYLIGPGGEFPYKKPGSGEPAYQIWQVRGTLERDGAMIIWGPAFEGKRLDLLIQDDTQKDAALDALRHWIRARLVLETVKNPPYPWPAGAIVSGETGAILFPPDQLIRRSINAEGPESWLEGAERWVHPDLSGSEAAVFAAGTMLYRIFCGALPFPNRDINLVRQDIREGIFFPPHLMAPGLDCRLALLITKSIAPFSHSAPANAALRCVLAGYPRPQNGASRRSGDNRDLQDRKNRPSLEELQDFLGPVRSRGVDGYFHPLNDRDQEKIRRKRNQFQKTGGARLRAKRFVRRNTAIIAAVLAAALALGLIIQSIRRDRADAPTTKGMSPREVVRIYYDAFGDLNHALMDACVIKKAGKDDIGLVQNLFILSRVRQAYEGTAPVLNAQDWVDAGFPATESSVFGVSDLELEFLEKDESDGEVRMRASYKIWVPDHDQPVKPTAANSRWDELRLIFHKDAWRIAEIRRISLP
jgi:hypothetical protein